MQPKPGQIMPISMALSNLVDGNNNPIKFKRSIPEDETTLVKFHATGSDGNQYSLSAYSDNVVIAITKAPTPEEAKEKLNQIVEELDKPVIAKAKPIPPEQPAESKPKPKPTNKKKSGKKK